MARREKQERRLEGLEIELRERLLPILEKVAQGRGTAFFVASPDRIAIQNLAEEILGLAGNIGLSKKDLLASRILNAFDQATDTANEHRLGPIRLAQTLLEEVRGSRANHAASTAP